MKILLPLMFLVCVGNQLPAQKDTGKTDSVINQANLERVWTEKLFKDKYFPQEHTRYPGKIVLTDTFYFHFGHPVFRIRDSTSGLITLSKSGILYPDVIPPGITCTDTTPDILRRNKIFEPWTNGQAVSF